MLQALIAALLVSAALAIWFGRAHVEAAASAVFGIAKSGEENSAGRRGRRRGGGGAQPVVVSRAGEARNDVTIEAIGTARARQSVTIFAPIAGEITASSVKAGQRVRKGQTLFQLDEKKARLALDIARSRLLDAERKLKRAEQLLRRNVSSNATVDDARTAFQRAEIELRQAKEVMRDLAVEAPFDGVVGIPKVEIGDRVAPNTPLVTLDDRAELIVEFEVPERYAPRLTVGHAVEGRTPGYDREAFAGAVRSIDSRIDAQARTVVVRAALDNADDRLRPGMSFAVTVTLPGKAFPRLPELALQFSQQGNYVWAVREGKARKVAVVLVRRLGNEVLIDGKLAVGELVVVEGVQRLKDGSAVTFEASPEGKPQAAGQPRQG